MRALIPWALLAGCATSGSIVLSGGDTAPPAAGGCPSLALGTDEVDFQEVPIGQEATAEVALVNDCQDGEPLIVSAAFQGDAAFAVSQEGAELAPGESARLVIRFAPTGYEPRSGAVSVVSNAAGAGEVVIYLTGSAHPDSDGDGYEAWQVGGDDCDDADPLVYPGGEDEYYDGVDGDCAGDSDYDADADGYDSDLYGGDDCDDADPALNPEAPETREWTDEDCDGRVDEDFLSAGDVIVTEFMAAPRAVDDAAGEWIEVSNISGETVDLVGWRISGEDGDAFVIDTTAVVPPGESLVLGLTTTSADNGGAAVNYVYDRDAFSLSDDADGLRLSAGALDVFELTYGEGWPLVEGASVALDPSRQDPEGALDPASWCPGQALMSGGDRGSPGDPNAPCGPAAAR